MKVLNIEPYGYSKMAVQIWKNNGFNYNESSWDSTNNEEYDSDILIVRLSQYLDEKRLRNFKKLKVVVSATTGLDHIDLDYLKKNNIRLVALKGESNFLDTIPSTAEHAWGLILSIVRNIPSSFKSVTDNIWERDLFRGYELKGKSLGIIGLGRIGKKLAFYGSAFDMKVLYFDPYIANRELGIKCKSLDELLSSSDIISLNVHLSEDTKKMLNRKNLVNIKRGAFLINTSRGKIWDEEAIVNLLKNKQIQGVATDVLENEQIIGKSPLLKGSKEGLNIIITPHIGGATWDAMWSCEEFLAEKVTREFASGYGV